MPFEDWRISAAAIALVGALLAVMYRGFRLFLLTRTNRETRASFERERLSHSAILCPDFDSREIKAAQSTYVRPDCAQVDPANEAQMHTFASVREPIFDSVNRFVDDDQKRHLIVLADSGMGKTTFCLNYFGSFSKRESYIALVSLARPGADAKIGAISAKRSTVLLLDALDESPEAIHDGAQHLSNILAKCAEFKTVILTCRSQFFENDAAIPTQTGISRITPRGADSSPTYELSRLYLLPFTPSQVAQFLATKFPLLSFFGWTRRARARALLGRIPELAVRPMLLTLVPDLIRENREPREVYELYEYMIQRWIEREARWIMPEDLSRVSVDLALFLSAKKAESGVDRAFPDEIKEASDISLEGIDWSHLTTRSLLNRDSEGRLKFAHNSIREFLIVRAALGGDTRALEVRWTDFMRDIFISFTRSDAYEASSAEELLARAFAVDEPRKVPFPVAEALSEPAVRTKEEFRTLAAAGATRRFDRASLPLQLRRLTVKESASEGFRYVHDLEFDLIWRVIDMDSPLVGSDYSLYRTSFGDLIERKFSGVFELPSFPEFLSLIRLQSVTEINIVRDYDFYWVGDKLGEATYMIASLSRTLVGEGIVSVLHNAPVSNTEVRLNLYAIDVYRQRNTLTNLRALELRVRRGALRRGAEDEQRAFQLENR